MNENSIQADHLSSNELNWLSQQRAACAQLVNHYLDASLDQPPSIAQLHQAFDNWMDSFVRQNQTGFEPNAVALSISVVLGDHIANATQLDWMIVTDSFGTDIMLYTPGNEGKYTDIVNAPLNMVAKRIESRESGWILDVFDSLVDELNQMTK